MKNKETLTVLFLVFFVCNIFALGNKETAGAGEVLYSLPQQNQMQSSTVESRAEQIMKSLTNAYPLQIESVEFRNDDWAVLLRDTWYYYCDGKLLPQNLISNSSNYSPQPFLSNYPAELPQWEKPGQEESLRFLNMTNNRNQNPPRRSPLFFDDLWRAHNQGEAYERVKTIRFLGKPVTVHYLVMENLALVEEHILAAARTEPQVQVWVDNISSLEGWSWRNIADTQSRSYHSYGLAIDIIPKSYGGKDTYWLWTSRYRQDWWNVSYNERFHPPAAVIKAFEKFGFIWGGKWLYFDTMHFEYRPEILILSGMPPETQR